MKFAKKIKLKFSYKFLFLIPIFFIIFFYLFFSKNTSQINISLFFEYKPKANLSVSALFQTDDYNNGLRYEIYNDQLSKIIRTDSNRNYYANRIIDIKHNQKYSLDIKLFKIFNYCTIDTYLDNDLVDNYHGLCHLPLKNIKFSNGFDMNRPFLGSITEEIFNINMISLKEMLSYSDSLLKISLEFFAANFNFLILIFSLIILLNYKIFIDILNEFFNSIQKIIKNSSVIYLLIPNLLISFFVPQIFALSITLLIFYIIGINIFLLFNLVNINKNFDKLTFTIFHGFSLVTLIGSIFIFLSLPIYFAFSLIFLLILISCILNRKNLIIIFNSQTKESYLEFKYLNILFFIISFFLLLYIHQGNFAPYRIGPDIVSYANMAQFLIEGKSFNNAYDEIKDLNLLNINEIVQYNQLTMSWSFAHYFRYGLSFYNSFIHLFSSTSHVYSTLFISMLFPFFLSIFLAAPMLKSIKKNIFFIFFIATLFNSNYLNLLFEGFYANLFFLPFLIYLFYVVSHFYIKNNKINKFIFYSTIITILNIFFVYPEGLFFIVIPLLIILFFMNYLISGFTSNKRILFLILFILFLISSIYITDKGSYIIEFIFRSLFEGGTHGYNQPRWSLPHEILGLTNIFGISYLSSVGQIVSFQWYEYINILLYSGFIFLIGFLFLKNKYYTQFQMETSAFIYIILIFFYALLFSKSNNYIYYKSYVSFLPILVATFFVIYNKTIIKYKKIPNVDSLISLIIFLSGSSYLFLYLIFSNQIKDDEMMLYKKLNKYDEKNYFLYLGEIPKLPFIYSSFFNHKIVYKEHLCMYDFTIFPNNKLINNQVLILTNEKFIDVYEYKNLVFKNNTYGLLESKFNFNDFKNKICSIK